MAAEAQTRYRLLGDRDILPALSLWRSTPGVGISGGDDPESLGRFLTANPGLCWCAERSGTLCGTILCGSDGRRGYIYHLAVRESARNEGIGRELVRRVHRALNERGIPRCHAMVFASNDSGRAFWERVAWRERPDLVVFSVDTGEIE